MTEQITADPAFDLRAAARESRSRKSWSGLAARMPALRLRIRTKMIALLLVFGLLPAGILFGLLKMQEMEFHEAMSTRVAMNAIQVVDIIDRNLFERYGDVQAFALNTAATDPMNWSRPGDDNPLVRAMNGYMTGYGIYKLMLLVAPDGRLLAVNSVDAKGKAVKTELLYGRTFADASWFKNVMAGKFLLGRNGLTGTAVEQPATDKLVADIYGDDGFVIPFAAPVYNARGKTVAVWVNFADFGLVEDIVAAVHADLKKDGMAAAEITLLDPTGTVIVDYDPVGQGWSEYKRNFEVIGKLNLAKKGVQSAVDAVAGKRGAMESMHARKKIVQASGFAHSHGAYDYPGLDWSALVRVPSDQAFAAWDSLIVKMLTSLAIAAAVIAAVGALVGTLFAKPIQMIAQTMDRIRQGDTDMTIDTGAQDEIGDMSRSLVELRDSVAQAYQLQQMVEEMPINVVTCDIETFQVNYINRTALDTFKQVEDSLPVKVAELNGQCIDRFHKNPERIRKLLADPSNLPHRGMIKIGPEDVSLQVNPIRDKHGNYKLAMMSWSIVTEQTRMVETFEKNVLGAVETVASASTEMQSAASAMTSTAEETTRQASAVAAASEEASTNVQTAAASAEELSASVGEISRQVAQSADIAGKAVEEAEKTNATIKGLAEAAQKIGEVVELINDIAAQTNLLALNATIEAARAGEAGKGFAVVASEVKSLANQTAKATEEIANQIGSMQSVTTEAVEAIQGIGETIGRINEIATGIASAVEEQGAATQEIARNVQQASAGTGEVSSNIAGVSQAASETGSSASQVLESAGELSKLSESLRGEVQGFLTTLRAS